MNIPQIEIDVNIMDDRWVNSMDNVEEHSLEVINFALKGKTGSSKSLELSITLCDDKIIKDLNGKYRNKDKPTNVLSFPMTEKEDLLSNKIPVCILGDIIISYDTICSEAQQQSKKLEHHYTHMLVHGCLHLLHFDHQNDVEAQIMESEEIRILSTLGIKNPYET